MKNVENFDLNNDLTGGGYRRSYHLAWWSYSAKRYLLPSNKLEIVPGQWVDLDVNIQTNFREPAKTSKRRDSDGDN